MSFVSRFIAALAVFTLASPAQADWWEASTDHFVIYADDSERDVRRFADQLERYHAAMEFVTGREVGKPSPSNRVVIFVAGNQRDIRDLVGSDSRWIRGFYVPRAGASRAFVEDIGYSKGGELSESMTTLLHEYAHHFLMSSTAYGLPRWMNEGAAEFFASASFDRDGSVSVGRPAYHRGYELTNAVDVSADELLDPDLYERNRSRRYDAFYGRSWLLYHYLTLSGERRGQVSAYGRMLLQGMPSIEAARAAFGDLNELDDDLDDYLRSSRMNYVPVPSDRLDIGDIVLRRLPEGEAAAIEVRMQSQRGVNAEQAAELVIDAREVAAEYPDDPGVLTALAEAEYDAGNDDAAIAAADRAIAIDPDRRNAYVQKGFALFRKAGDAQDREAAYAAAMAPFSALNQRENDHPMPLIYYYRSFVERGLEPSETARHALERASQLAPFDHSLAMNVGLMQANEGKIALARKTLAPVATNPHGGSFAETAARYREELADIPEGTPWYPVYDAQADQLEIEDLPDDES